MKAMLSGLDAKKLVEDPEFGRFITTLKVFVSQLIFDTSLNV